MMSPGTTCFLISFLKSEYVDARQEAARTESVGCGADISRNMFTAAALIASESGLPQESP
jgi:hypothetical protein